MLPQIKQIKQHQVYFEKGDYEQRTAKYKRDGGSKLTPEELLLVAKGFFIEGELAECLNVLKSISPRHSSKILFERQSLHFRTAFLLKRNIMPSIQDLTSWREILDLVQNQSKNTSGPPIELHHLNVIKHYKDFLSLTEQRLTNKIMLEQDIFKQQKTLESKAKKFEGFPIYLLSAMWIEDFNKAMAANSDTYLAPINNFSIVNDIFESLHYQDPCDIYKNTQVFPGVLYATIGKKYWNYLHSLINDGKEVCPIKRLVSLQQSNIYESKAKVGRTHPLIPIAVKCDQQLIALQLTHNKTLEEEFYATIDKRYGVGQFRIKSGENLVIYDIEGQIQVELQGFNKILYYHKVKIPKNIPPNQLRPLLKFQFKQLPAEYLKDPQNGLKGLENIGNSCYLNSCIQCLSNTQDLNIFVTLNHSLQNINFSSQKDGIVVAAFSDLLKSLWNKEITKSSMFPRKFKKAFGQKNTQFLDKTQEDAHEFLLCLLNSLHEELKAIDSKLLRSISKLQITTDQNKVKEYFQKHSLEQNKSIIMNIFRGKIHNTMNCSFCKTLSHSYDVFLALTLPIPQKQSSFIDIYYCGWQTRETKKYRIHLQNMKSAQDIIRSLIQVVKKKTEVEYYYVFGQINKQNLTFEETSLISSQKISLLNIRQVQDLLKKTQIAHFILYEMKKKEQTELLALLEYRYDINGLVLGFPRLMHAEEKYLTDSYSTNFKREIAANDRQNFFRSWDIQQLSISKKKQNKHKAQSKIFDYTIQAIFSSKQKLFKGTDEIYEQLNDPNTNYSIYDCFDLMRQPQILEDSWTCGNCKKTERVEKRQQIAEANNILVIHLKRFKADYRKIKTMIEYPVRGLEIDRWIENKQEGQGNYKYDLYAVCLHTGTAEYGHYKAYCKHFVSQKWHQFDDGYVQQIQEAKVVTPHAYMLFYKKINQI